MDSEEILKKRREKILQRSGIIEKKEEIEPKTNEISIREQKEIIDSIDHYKVDFS